MINADQFNAAWAHLCDRFGREPNAKQARAYLEYLTDQLDTEQFLAAARAIWATAKFFPRPADFLLVAASGEWATVLAAVSAYNPPDAAWHEHWKQLTPRALAACQALGGVTAMRTIYDRDVLRLKAAWEQAYEQQATTAALALPPARLRALRPV